MPLLFNKKELCILLGIIAYVQRFIPNCSKLTAPLNRPIGKKFNELFFVIITLGFLKKI